MKIVIEKIKWCDTEGLNCETCGYHANNGEMLKYNGEMFWEKSSIGCYSGVIPDNNEIQAYTEKVKELVCKTVTNDEKYLYIYHTDTSVDEVENLISEDFDLLLALGFEHLELYHQAVGAWLKDAFMGQIEVELDELEKWID